MKKLLIMLITMLLVSCVDDARQRRKDDTSDDVKDNYGNEFDVVVIEGCEFYLGGGQGQHMAKVDCDCKPNR